MKLFELSSRKNRNGRRKFKAVLHEIFPDSCVDEVNQIGTEYNKNGITWIREYCENALDSIKGMSLRCEFIDEDRTELLGHGDTGVANGEPTYEDAVVIGTFTNGYITTIETESGVKIVCVGEGEIDAQCYHNFVEKLESDIANDIYPSGSVEIMRTENNPGIVYKYGYVDEGRIPVEFNYSGYALLGVTPADESARLIELNEKHKEELEKMTDLEIKAIVSQVISELKNHESEIKQVKDDFEAKLNEAIEAMNNAVAEKAQLEAQVAELNEKVEALTADLSHASEDKEALQTALDEAKAKERLNELNSAISDFTEEQRAYAQAEIDAFKADPIASEINTVVDKIWVGIGKESKAKADEDAKHQAEQNSAAEIEDIFSGVDSSASPAEDMNIF